MQYYKLDVETITSHVRKDTEHFNHSNYEYGLIIDWGQCLGL